MTASPSPSTASTIDVLVVDDVEQNLVATEALLARPGLRVLKAANGEQALELLLSHDVAVALIDVQMPTMDGFALAELMRGASRTQQVPIIFLTAAREERQRVFRGYDAGAVDFLHKPIDPQVLRSKVDVFVQLASQRRELEQALRFNETMAAVLAHDLRTPLSAVLTCADVVVRAGPEGPVRQAGERIKSSGSRMARMIDQLLDLARVRAGTLPIRRRRVGLQELAEQAMAEVQQARPDTRVELRSEAGDDAAHVDPDRIAQVIVNLLDNAARHGEPGTPIQVRVTEPAADRLGLAISNRGVLPAHLREDLFAPFRSGRNGDRGGLGLGLYIVDQFVRAHGGSVRGSSHGDTTVFEVELPRRA